MIRNFFYILFFYLIFVVKSFSSEFIGVIGVAVGDIYNQKNEKLLNGSKIFYGDTILANSKSNAQILFLDETVMTVGENTELTIDDFIYMMSCNNLVCSYSTFSLWAGLLGDHQSVFIPIFEDDNFFSKKAMISLPKRFILTP